MFDKLETLDDLFQHELKDLYSAENQLVKALPQMASAAKDSRLRAGIEKPLKEPENQIARLENIGKALDIDLDGETCKVMNGLVKEGQKTLSGNATDEVLDAASLAASQRIEHYEISDDGTAVHYADHLGYADDASLLRRTLPKEQLTDTTRNDLAKNYITPKGSVTRP